MNHQKMEYEEMEAEVQKELRRYGKATGQGGYLLVSLGLVVLFTLAAGAFAYSKYNDQVAKQAVSEARSNIAMMIASIKTNFQNEDSYAALDTDPEELLIQLQAVPSSLARGNTVRNEFGGVYSFTSSNGGDSGADDSAFFEVSTDNVPQDACIALASPGTNMYQQIEVGSTVVDGTLSEAQSACSEGNNTLSFTLN